MTELHDILLYAPLDYEGIIVHCKTCDQQLGEWLTEEIPFGEVSRIVFEHEKDDVMAAAKNILKEVSLKDLLSAFTKMRKP